MKLVLFSLFAVCLCSLANMLPTTRSMTERKLDEILSEIEAIKKLFLHREDTMITPQKDIEDCCSLSALKCFQDNLTPHLHIRNIKKLNKSLGRPETKNALSFCNTENATPTCPDCALQPKENATVFFNRLESLIQRGKVRLSM